MALSDFIANKFMGGDKARAQGEWADKGRAFIKSAASKGMKTNRDGDELIASPRLMGKGAVNVKQLQSKALQNWKPSGTPSNGVGVR